MLVIPALIAGLSAAWLSSPAAAAAAAATSPYPSEMAQAMATGAPVEVASETTQTSQVFAEPDGTYSLQSSARPVRVRQGGSWVKIDTSLHVNTDNTLSPNATTVPVSFSGGGTGPLVKVGDASGEVDLTWPSPLPAPAVSGDTVTYSNVLDGVDLVLIAQPEGYADSLVVKTPAAAQYLVDHPMKLTAVTSNLGLVKRADGGLDASDSSGNAVFSGPTPTVWDSSRNVEGGQSPGDAPSPRAASNAKLRKLGVGLAPAGAGTQVTLTVPADTVSDPTTTYPLYVDPAMASTKVQHRLTVESGGWNYYDSTTEPLRVGYCGWAGCTSSNGNARSYISFDTTALTGKPTTAYIASAAVFVTQVWNAESTATPVNLTKSAPFYSSTTYPGGYAATLQQISSACGSSGTANQCSLMFNNSTVVSYFQGAANQDITSVAMALSAPSENVASYWKKFDQNPSIEIHYSFPPSVPTGLNISSKVTCGGTNYTTDNTPTVSATAHDNEPTPTSGDVGFAFDIWKNNPATVDTVYNTKWIPGSGTSDQTASWTTNDSTNTNSMAGLGDGQWGLRVRAKSLASDATDPNAQPTWSSFYYFTVDTQKPGTPSVSSFTYPADNWGAPANYPGTFAFSATGNPAGFTWAIDGAPPVPISTDCTFAGAHELVASGGTASLTIPAGLTATRHTLSVESWDVAHNGSTAIANYSFYVAPNSTGSNVIEAEKFVQPVTTPNTYEYTDVTDSMWSGGTQSKIVANAPNAAVSYTLNAPTSGYYALGARLTTDWHYGILKFQLDNQDIIDSGGQTISADTTSPNPAIKYQPLGGFNLTQGAHKLTVVLTGTNSTKSNVYNGTYGPEGVVINNFDDKGYSAGVDAFILAQLTDTSSYATLGAAFNNHGIVADGTKGADFDLTNTGRGLSETALHNVGVNAGTYAGTPFTVTTASGSVSFTIPTPNGNLDDNVVAHGQTIAMPIASGTNGTYPTVGLANPGSIKFLVASTCGTLQQGWNKYFHLTYNDELQPPDGPNIGYGDDAIPLHIPDWGLAADTSGGITGSVTAAYSNINGANNGAAKTLYVISVPFDANQFNGEYVTAVTLPDVGTSYTQSCSTAALHILAMTPVWGS